MTPVTKLFRELRKQGYTAKQRAGDCRSCAMAAHPEVEIYTIDQSYGKKTVWVYFQIIEGTVIKEACDKLGIWYKWDGKDSTAFEILKEEQ